MVLIMIIKNLLSDWEKDNFTDVLFYKYVT